MKLRLAEDLTLPIDVATQTLLIFGKRGSGKSTTATRLAEQLMLGKVPITVLDPVDVWWGLKASNDGRSASDREVYVFGGAHSDLPLEHTAGVLMADTIVEHRINAVFVLRQFSNRQKAQFVADFADRLFQRNREAMHLFCEEAHELMPQNPYGGEEEMLGRMLRLQKLGRNSGIGMTSITQRPASLNKNATTQGEILIAHRLLGPQDRKAIEEWIKYHHAEAEKQTVLASLPELKTGEAWIWAPDFPEDEPIGLRRTKVLMPDTFDSRRTPKPGERVKQPRALAPVDLAKLRDKMAATIERSKADDPKELKKKIIDLQKHLGQAQQAKPAAVPSSKEKRVEVEIIKEAQIARLEKLYDRAEARVKSVVDKLAGIINPAMELLHDERAEIGNLLSAARAVNAPAAPRPARTIMPNPIQRRLEPRPLPARETKHRNGDSAPEGSATLGTKGKRRILIALAQNPSGIDDTKLAILADIAKTGGTMRTYLTELRGAGWIDGDRANLKITDAGLEVLGDFEPLPTGEALIDYWRNMLGSSGKRTIFDVLVEAYPNALTKEEIAERAGMAADGGTLRTYMTELRGLQIIEGRKEIKAGDVLFEGAQVLA